MAKRYRVGDKEREAVLQVLQEAYAAGRLDLDEVQTRQDQTLQARFDDDLSVLVEDLPESDSRALLPERNPLPPGHAAAPAASVGKRRSTLAIMSGKDIVLEPGSFGLASFAFWGGNKISLTDCMGPGRVVVLDLHAVMGGNTLQVPPGVRIVDNCIAIMAGNHIASDAQGDGSNGTVILRGVLFWGGNDVTLAQSAG